MIWFQNILKDVELHMIWVQKILKDVELADSNCLKVFFDILNCLGDMAKNLEGSIFNQPPLPYDYG